MRTPQKFLGLAVIFFFFAVSSVTGALAQGERRLAFVIGNGAYQSGQLATASNDAGLIAQTLQAAGFDVVGARDVDQESLRGALHDFLGKVSAAGPDAVVFVYLAGHGVQLEGENYFLPVDAQIANPNDVPLQAMRISDITRALSGLPAKVNVVVLDAARPNPFPQSKEPLAGGLALVDADPNMLIAFNAAPGTVAPESKGPYGAYAQALAEMMREGGLSLQDVFDRTRLRVSEVTQGGELPWSDSKIAAPFVFFDRDTGAPPPEVSAAETREMRTKAIGDFSAHDAYVAALDRDTLRGYEDFLVAYPHDPMAKRVRAIVAARREAITWRETWQRDTPEAYWSYLRRYPQGPHAWDADRRLEHFDVALEPPEDFTAYAYDVPPPPEEEIVYVDRPALYFDDPDFDFAPPPPVAVIFLPPPPPDFVVLAPPPPPVDIFVLPTPVFVPMPAFFNPPRHIVPPPNDIIFNNIHNTTVINNINNTTINGSNQPGRANGGGPTTGQKTTGAAIGVGAAALAARVALPPRIQKRAALSNQDRGTLGKFGQGAAQGQRPGSMEPQSKAPGRLSTDHALPGANGRTLPLVNGKPPVPGKRGPAGGNKQQATGNAAGAPTGQQIPTDQGKRNQRRIPNVNGVPAGSAAPNAQGRLGRNNLNVPSNQSAPQGSQKKLPRNQAPSSVNVQPKLNTQSAQPQSRQQKPNGQATRPQKPQFDARPKPQSQERRLPQQAKPQSNAQPRPQIQKRRVPQQAKPQPNAQPRPQIQERRVPQQAKPQFNTQPRPQVQERRAPPPQQPRPQAQERRAPQPAKPQQQAVKKKPSCGHPGEPACGK